MPGFDTVASAPDWFTLLGDLDARVELNIGGAWTDVSGRVFSGDSVVIGRGHPDESTTATASTLTATIDNSDGALTYQNPYGPYYGALGALNTPLRVSVPDVSAYLRLEGDSASYATCPAVSGLKDFEVWVDADADNWYQDQIIAAQWDQSGSGRSWVLGTTGGMLALDISTDGTASTFAASHSARLPVTHGRISVRASYTASTGAVVFYLGQHCQGWAELSAASLPTGGPKSTSTAVELGCASNASELNAVGFNGKVFAFAILGAVGGTVANAKASADFTVLTPGVISWGPWTLAGTAEVSNRNYRFHGECGAWPLSWSPGGANARIALEAGGLLRRLGASDSNVNSAMYRAYTNVTNAGVEGYWPFEDGSQATQLGSAMGGPPFRWYGAAPELSASSDFDCSAPIVTLNGASLVGYVPAYSATDAAVVRFLLSVPADGDTSGTLATIYYTGSILARVNVGYTAGGLLGLSGWDANDNQLFSTSGVAFNVDGAPVRLSVEMTQTASNVYMANLVTLAPGASTGNQFPITGLSGAVGAVARIAFNPNGLLQSTSIGHVSVESVWTSLFDLGQALNAYKGEAAGTRFQRLCAEEGIAFRGIGDPADTVPMGAQTIETLAQLLQECVDADQGAWIETRQVLGWGFRTRVSMGNQDAAVALDYNQDHLTSDPQPTVDDQVVKNDITVSSPDGASSRLVLEDGSGRSVQAIGRYDTTFTVNVADSLLDSETGWLLHSLTVDEPRYKQISVDLANTAITDLYWAILSAELGDRLTVGNLPVWLPPGLIDQLMQGAGETIGLKEFKVAWNGVPASPWNVAYIGDAVLARADSTLGGALAADAGSADTSLTVWTASPPLWVTDASQFPFDIAVGGERVTVTAISGSSNKQTFTVARSVNGVVKAHATNTGVHLWFPGIVSL